MNHIDQLLEAIKEGTITIRHKDGSQWQLDAADKQTVSDALEKQIMKKPIVKKLGRDIDVYCPTCGEDMIHMDARVGYPYCHHCGQRYDWS